MHHRPLNLFDLRSGIFLTLPEILAVLPPRVAKTNWSFGAFVDVDGWEYLEVVVEGHDRLDDGLEPMERVPHSRLLEVIKPVRQVIWGVFTGYEGASDTSWIVLNAIDSSFWRVETDDLETRRLLRMTFSDVREGLL